jgi:hypothetical protein
MKKYLFFYFFLILSTILSAQDSLRLDSLVHARLSEGQVNLLKGDLYHAGLSFQQVLDLARAGKSPLAESKVTDAYKGLISVSEKTYNYVKAYQLEVQYSNLRDSLLRRQYSLQQKNQEAGLRQYEKDLLKEQDTSKEKIRKLDQAMESLAGKEEQLKLYVSILAVAALVLSLLLLLLLLRWRRFRKKQRAEAISTTITVKEPPAKPNTVEAIAPHVEEKQMIRTPPASIAEPVLEKVVDPDEGKIKQIAKKSEQHLHAHLGSYFLLNESESAFLWAPSGTSASFVLCAGFPSAKAGHESRWMASLEMACAGDKVPPPDVALGRLPAGEGLNAALCLFDLKGGWLRFCCANSKLWLIRKGELKEFASDPQPAGVTADSKFTLQTLGLRKGDCLYICCSIFDTHSAEETALSDQLKALFLANHSLPLEQQQETIFKALSDARATPLRAKDVLILGLRI